MGEDTFTCANCKDTFGKGWSDEEAQAEYAENFTESAIRGVEIDVVCDDCYKELTAWKSPQQAEDEQYGKDND